MISSDHEPPTRLMRSRRYQHIKRNYNVEAIICQAITGKKWLHPRVMSSHLSSALSNCSPSCRSPTSSVMRLISCMVLRMELRPLC